MPESDQNQMIQTLLNDFADPPADCRPMSFWSWNGDMTEAGITERLEQFNQRGLGGAFLHPRPGMITEYLSPRFFELWQHALAESERLGLECHIYDENSYPSGFGGGHVVGNDPYAVGRVLEWQLHRGPTNPPRAALAAYRVTLSGTSDNSVSSSTSPSTGERVDPAAAKTASSDEPVLTMALGTLPAKSFHGGYPHVDISRPGAGQAFIDTTHERYAKHVSEAFGQTIKYVFTDEPHLAPGGNLALSQYIIVRFKREHGYDLTEHLDALAFDREGAQAVRFDYHRTLQAALIENFFKPLHDWCEANDLAQTGHVMEHHWPSPIGHPSAMHILRWMQAPGNDLLGFQFDPTERGANGVYRLNLKELSSVANQLGRQRTLVETTGGGGYAFTPAQAKPIEDFCLVNGVTVINPHLSHQTISGARKYDWPHTYSDHSPWWDDYRPQADHVSRVVSVLKNGREHNRVLVLNPTTTGWTQFRPPALTRALGDEPTLGQLKESQTRLLEALAGGQVDFDLGDELILEELADVDEAWLAVGHARYELVIVPPAMENLMGPTLELLEAWVEAGNKILVAGDPPTHVDGRPDDRPATLAQKPGVIHWLDPSSSQAGDAGGSGEAARQNPWSALVELVRQTVPPRLSASDGSPLPEALEWHRRELDDRRCAWYFINPWTEPIEAEVTLDATLIAELDTTSGQAFEPTATLKLPPGGHGLWLSEGEAEAGGSAHQVEGEAGAWLPIKARPKWREGQAVAVTGPRVERLNDNVLTLDYAAYQGPADNQFTQPLNTFHADRRRWQDAGWSANPWSFSIQYRRSILDRPWPGGAFGTQYRFDLAAELARDDERRGSISLAIERPWLWRCQVNGSRLELDEPWFDEHIRRGPMGHLLSAGWNTIELTSDLSQPLAEVMPVYVLGDFAIDTPDDHFRLTMAHGVADGSTSAASGEVKPTSGEYGPHALAPGDWVNQGLPFYPWHMRYTWTAQLDEPAEALRVELDGFTGSSARVHVGQSSAIVLGPPHQAHLVGPFDPGTHSVQVDVAGSLKNMMGPLHNPGLPGPWNWDHSPTTQPPASEYRRTPTGLRALTLTPLASRGA